MEKFKNMALLERLKAEYNRVFPRSECSITLGSLCPDMALISLHLSNCKEECAHNIRENDIFNFLMTLEENGDEYTFECDLRHFLTRPENPYLAFGSRRVPFRKTVGSEKKIEIAFSRFVSHLRVGLLEEYNNHNICVEHMEIVAQKLGVEL